MNWSRSIYRAIRGLWVPLAVLVRYNRRLAGRHPSAFPAWLERFLPWLVFLGLVGFIGTSAYSVFKSKEISVYQLSPFVVLIGLGLLFGIWFIVCFTGDATTSAIEQDRRRRQSFRFCYVFTLSTLVVMIVPVANPWQPDVVGPISLIRGCVDAQRDPNVPKSIQCGEDDLLLGFDGVTGKIKTLGANAMPASGVTTASAQDASKGAPPTTPAPSGVPSARSTPPPTPPSAKQQKHHASGPTGSVGGKKTPAQSLPPSNNATSTSSTGSVPGTDTTNASSTKGSDAPASAHGASGASVPNPAPTFQRRFGVHTGFVYEPSYPWLIVIGGTYGTVAEDPHKATPQVVGDVGGASAAVATQAADGTITPRKTTADTASASSPSPHGEASAEELWAGKLRTSVSKPHQIIEGGFVLPYYIVLLSFLGASIALTRRIPELQKRSEPGYEGTIAEPRFDFRTVREATVFQIMQLITAPFVAMVAYYAISPNSPASGIAVGFLSGFSSELVLLQIRGVVEGLFPKSITKTTDSSAKTGNVVGRVTYYDKDPNGKGEVERPAANASIQLSGGDYKDVTDSNGRYALAEVPFGSRVLTATGSLPNQATLSAKRLVMVAPAVDTVENLILTPPASAPPNTSNPVAPSSPRTPHPTTSEPTAAPADNSTADETSGSSSETKVEDKASDNSSQAGSTPPKP